ncbi:phage baseplate protein [Vibrio gallicus]|uniref:phage baseplate protein n=1 Tax=Vibrio gallicus TaxID=190897 RepID=UPI0021C3647B|nr:hypothetical protein [Vibrio gallicus]
MNDNLGKMLAQKLVTTLLYDKMNLSDKNPYLVIKSVGKYGNKPQKQDSKQTDEELVNGHLAWVDNYFEIEEEVLKNLVETRVEFDTVTGYQVQYSGSLTEHRMFNGDTVADGFKKSNVEYQLTAKVSNTARMSTHNVSVTADLLKEAWNMGLPVYLHLPDISAVSGQASASTYTPNENGYIYGIITNLSFDRNTDIQDGLNITMSIVTPTFSQSLEASSYENHSSEVEDIASDKESGSARIEGTSLCSQWVRESFNLFSKDNYKDGDLRSPEQVEDTLKSMKGNGASDCDIDGLMAIYRDEHSKFTQGLK